MENKDLFAEAIRRSYAQALDHSAAVSKDTMKLFKKLSRKEKRLARKENRNNRKNVK